MKIKSNEPKKEVAELFKNTVVKKIEVNDELKKSFYSYAMAVNVSRKSVRCLSLIPQTWPLPI